MTISNGYNAAASARFLKSLSAVTIGIAAFAGGIASPVFAAENDVPAIGSAYAAPAKADDAQYQALFTQWKTMDAVRPGVIAVPSEMPVQGVTMTSGFGVRSDPFRGAAAMHAGVDLAAPIGTPIYATADGIVGRAGWLGGYGNLVEVEHGRGIATRYGHLSQILVHAGQRVRRGDLIAKMGSTGRSTGSHLHYEVRIDGRAVSPVPYLESAGYLAAFRKRAPEAVQVAALGGPEDPGQ